MLAGLASAWSLSSAGKSSHCSSFHQCGERETPPPPPVWWRLGLIISSLTPSGGVNLIIVVWRNVLLPALEDVEHHTMTQWHNPAPESLDAFLCLLSQVEAIYSVKFFSPYSPTVQSSPVSRHLNISKLEVWHKNPVSRLELIGRNWWLVVVVVLVVSEVIYQEQGKCSW